MNKRKIDSPQEHPFAPYVRILGKGKTGTRSLTEQEAYQAFSMILEGKVEPVQLGAFLMLLRVKEESQQELSGFVSAAKDHITAPANNIAVDLDWSSYAGKKRQLPWYLLACFCMANNGIRIFMHGASGHTAGRLYTEDVLKLLNIEPARCWPEVEQSLRDNSFCYMPLQHFCPVLKNIIDLRSLLGLRSPVHTLSRLLNPLNAPCSIQSIFHPSYADNHQQAALALGQGQAAVFKGEGGEIERRPEADCLVKRVINGQANEEFWPRLLSGRQAQPATLDIMHLIKVWRGQAEDEYGYQAIVGTMAIALQLLGKSRDQQQSLELAAELWLARDRGRI